MKKTVGSDVTQYIYLGWRCIQERDSSGNIVAEYVYGNNLDEVLQMRVAGSTFTGTTVAVDDTNKWILIADTTSWPVHALRGKIITLNSAKYTIADNVLVTDGGVTRTRITFADPQPDLGSNNSIGYAIDTSGQYTYHTDAQGNVVAMTNALGTLLEKIKYDVYGRMTALWALGVDDVTAVNGFISAQSYYANSVTKNPFLFQGQRLDGESGLYYMKNRYYDPETGRFITRDPARDGINLYAFVNNNPINFVDPMGLDKYNTPQNLDHLLRWR